MRKSRSSRTSPELRISSSPDDGVHVAGFAGRSAGSTSRVSDYMYAVESDGFYQIDATWRGGAGDTLSTIGGHVSMEVGRDAHPAGGWRDRVLLQHGYGRFHHDGVGELPLWRRTVGFYPDAWYADQLFRDSFDGPICTRTHGQLQLAGLRRLRTGCPACGCRMDNCSYWVA